MDEYSDATVAECFGQVYDSVEYRKSCYSADQYALPAAARKELGEEHTERNLGKYHCQDIERSIQAQDLPMHQS